MVYMNACMWLANYILLESHEHNSFFPFLIEKAEQRLKKWQDKFLRPFTTSAPEGKAIISAKPPPAVISVISCSPDTSMTIKRDLEGILQKQLVQREVDEHSFSRLDAMELEAVQAKVKVLEIGVEYRRRQSSEGVNGNRAGSTARDQLEPAGNAYVLQGLKEDVLSVVELVTRAIQKALREDLQEKEEAILALRVQWSIQQVNGLWHDLSLGDNYRLEEAHMRKQVSADVTAPDGTKVKVNLKAEEATNWQTGIKYKVKRSEAETSMSHFVPFFFHLRFRKVMLRP